MIVCGVIIIKITSKDGTVTEIKVPEGSKVEIVDESKMGTPARPSDLLDQAGKSANPATPDVIDFAAERTAAARLLRLGKGVVKLGHKDRQWIAILEAPLPAEPFCILDLEFQGDHLTDDELAVLVGCRRLESLDLRANAKLTAAGLTQLGSLPFLKTLDVGGTGVGDQALGWLTNCPSLTQISAVHTPMSAAGWESLPPCPRLTKIATSQRVGVAGLQRIVEQCPELRDLWIDDETIPDLNPLARLTRLRRLQTHANSLDGDWVDMLLNMPVFEDLFVDNPIAVDLEQLPELAPKLKRFGFRAYGGTRLVTSEKWAPITEMPGLLDLTIAGDVAVDGPGLRRIAAMPDLRRLHVAADVLSPGDVARFRSFTPDDVAAFRKQRPDVELLISGQNYPALGD